MLVISLQPSAVSKSVRIATQGLTFYPLSKQICVEELAVCAPELRAEPKS
jgi:hypothetical protein